MGPPILAALLLPGPLQSKFPELGIQYKTKRPRAACPTRPASRRWTTYQRAPCPPMWPVPPGPTACASCASGGSTALRTLRPLRRSRSRCSGARAGRTRPGSGTSGSSGSRRQRRSRRWCSLRQSCERGGQTALPGRQGSRWQSLHARQSLCPCQSLRARQSRSVWRCKTRRRRRSREMAVCQSQSVRSRARAPAAGSSRRSRRPPRTAAACGCRCLPSLLPPNHFPREEPQQERAPASASG